MRQDNSTLRPVRIIVASPQSISDDQSHFRLIVKLERVSGQQKQTKTDNILPLRYLCLNACTAHRFRPAVQAAAGLRAVSRCLDSHLKSIKIRCQVTPDKSDHKQIDSDAAVLCPRSELKRRRSLTASTWTAARRLAVVQRFHNWAADIRHDETRTLITKQNL